MLGERNGRAHLLSNHSRKVMILTQQLDHFGTVIFIWSTSLERVCETTLLLTWKNGVSCYVFRSIVEVVGRTIVPSLS